MLTIEYIPHRPAIPPHTNVITLVDGEIENWVNNRINHYLNNVHIFGREDLYLLVGQEMVITQFRVAVKQKLIPHTDIEIIFKDKTIHMDCEGRIDDWPDGFCDYWENMLIILMGPDLC